MKSREVYAVLASHLGPAFQAAGFKRTRTMLSWVRPQRANYLVVWCQVSQDGWDEYVGSKFTVEFQLSDEPVVGVHHRHRQRLPTMLTCEEREELRTIQNAVISSLRHPPASHPMLESDVVRKWYLKRLRTIDQPYRDRDDIWFRYASEAHLIAWAEFILGGLGRRFEQAEAWT